MKTAHTPSCIEPLEPRVAPAGIIAVSVSAGTLFLKSLSGATGNESIAITQNAPGELSIAPSNGTQLKLGSVLLPVDQAQTIETIFGGITVSLGEGDDTLVFDNLQIAKTLSVDLGNGTNSLTLQGNSSFGAINIKAGAGNDTVSVLDDSLTVAGTLAAKLGDGVNTVDILIEAGLTVGRDVSIITGKGNDDIEIGANRVAIGGKVSALTGSGQDFTRFTADESFTVAGEARMVSLGATGPSVSVTQSIRAGNILSVGKVFFSIGPSTSSSQELEAFGDSLLVHGSVNMTTVGNLDGTHELEIRGGTVPSSAVLGNMTLKGHSFLLVGQVGVLTGNLTVTSGARLQLLSFQGFTSLDDAFRIGGKVTIDTTKATTTIAQSTIAFGRFAPEGPVVVRDGIAAVTLQVSDSRFLGSVTISMGAGNDKVDIDGNDFPEATIFFGPVLIRGESGTDNITLGGAEPGDIVSFRNKITVDGGLDTDVLNLGTQVTFASSFPLVQINIP